MDGWIWDLRRKGKREQKYVEYHGLNGDKKRHTWVDESFNMGDIENWVALVVDVLDGQGLVSDITLLLLVVHIKFDIWRGRCGDRCRR